MHTITRTAITLHTLNTSAMHVAWQPRTGAIRTHVISLKMHCFAACTHTHVVKYIVYVQYKGHGAASVRECHIEYQKIIRNRNC